jgi:hypothetical protein
VLVHSKRERKEPARRRRYENRRRAKMVHNGSMLPSIFTGRSVLRPYGKMMPVPVAWLRRGTTKKKLRQFRAVPTIWERRRHAWAE